MDLFDWKLVNSRRKLAILDVQIVSSKAFSMSRHTTAKYFSIEEGVTNVRFHIR